MRGGSADLEAGQILVLALVFISAIVVVVSASLGFASTTLRGYNTMHDTRLARYAAEGAVEQLIVAEQANGTNSACSASPVSMTNGHSSAYATCTLLSTPLPLQRDVQVCAYSTAPTPGSCSSSNKLLLSAEVLFQDLPSGSGLAYGGEQVRSWSYAQN